jgi:hypothetical protein
LNVTKILQNLPHGMVRAKVHAVQPVWGLANGAFHGRGWGIIPFMVLQSMLFRIPERRATRHELLRLPLGRDLQQG